ncbi:hypothetical protein EOA13_31420 [Mesorhizobium sp. M7A.F.Ca.US.011.01.1.1]|uniref:hypothetical protein n=1 Tax=Mesorhizobium sp. M7A.F.Ca.US.011.01.1.1 TaxID=2496741 RepID=UPI000FCBE694|nr:hypothetical protein [Mesorhizobium sp. M7A.F.Ca.US.011.01.1.1]RUX24204.1 hypothetical protein EOA13_31420 [Mesorhizobium sp. M7A.F.Ca.US.011.01.1.1]
MTDDPLVKLHEALETVRKCFDEGTDDWQYRAINTFRHYLQAIGFERRLIDPIEALKLSTGDAVLLARRRTDEKKGTPKPTAERVVIAYAAAAVTTLKIRHGMKLPQALEAVAKRSGLDKGTVGRFRDNLSRGGDRVPSGAKEIYDTVMAEMRDLEYSAQEILTAVSGFSKFVG